MPARIRYPLLLVAAGVTAVVGAGLSIPAIRGWRIWGPLAHRVERHSDTTGRRVARVATPVAPPAVVPPLAPAAQTATGPSPAPVRVKAWKPSERQQLRDNLYLAGKANRPADAIAALEAWDAKHPRDPEALRELARLLVRNGRMPEGLARYRELLMASADSGARTEYAAALLALQQYDSAAANYRILIASDSENVDAHVGLARSLAWGNHPREAEPELRWVTLHAPSDTMFVVMLHVARNSYEPTTADAARWVAEDPQYAPYRLAFARLLAGEHRLDMAAAQFDTLVSANPPTLSLLREAAGVHAMAGDSVGDARLLRHAVDLAPNDTSLRQSYAEALAWSGERAAAVAQYDTLLAASGADPDLLIARGRLYAFSGDNAAAERDLAAAIAKRPTPEAWVMLGDVYRWEGDRRRAWNAYSEASALRPGDAGAEGGFAELAAAERRQADAILGHELGWNTFASYLGDNAGFDLSIAGLGGGFGIGSTSALLVGADARRLGSDNGAAAYLGLVKYYGSYRFSAEGGAVSYRERGDFGYGSLSAAGSWLGLWTTAEVRTGPTFQWLMSPRTLTYRGASASLTIPAGMAAFSFGVDRMWLSDGNDRTQLLLGARYALWRGVSAIYSGGMIGFERASALYWDPRRFTSHAMGLELSTQRDSGFSVSARVLPGIGQMSDGFETTDPNARTAAQVSSGLAVAYRRRWWSLTLDGDYAHGVRDSGYHSARASARLRITP